MERTDYASLNPEEQRTEMKRHFKKFCIEELDFDERKAEMWAETAVETFFEKDDAPDEGGGG